MKTYECYNCGETVNKHLPHHCAGPFGTFTRVPVEDLPEEPDLVNHPPHYTSHPSGVECITITEHMNFNIGNAVKYLWRTDAKGDSLENLKKARWYIDREIMRRSK